jgi:hypothetical protein
MVSRGARRYQPKSESEDDEVVDLNTLLCAEAADSSMECIIFQKYGKAFDKLLDGFEEALAVPNARDKRVLSVWREWPQAVIVLAREFTLISIVLECAFPTSQDLDEECGECLVLARRELVALSFFKNPQRKMRGMYSKCSVVFFLFDCNLRLF